VAPVSATNLPGIAEFIKEMAAAAAAGVPNATSLNVDPNAELGWLSVYAVQAVAKTMTGPITNTTLLAALNSATGINVKGLVTDWSPATPGPKGFPRIFVPTVWLSQVKNGQSVLVANQPLNMAQILGLS
jgi:hypothetical protein